MFEGRVLHVPRSFGPKVKDQVEMEENRVWIVRYFKVAERTRNNKKMYGGRDGPEGRMVQMDCLRISWVFGVTN